MKSARPGILPLHPGSAPTQPHCTCMSGLTLVQLALAQLYGALKVVNALAFEAKQATGGTKPFPDQGLYVRLERLEHLLNEGSELCLEHAFPQVKT